MDNSANNRYLKYDQSHCWQYDIRLKNYERDLKEAQLSKQEVEQLRIKDFNFSYVDKLNKEECKTVSEFIKRHEWLGNMPLHPTHRFKAMYKENLAGVIVMAMPNSFSYPLGRENRRLEKLISRGACISWSPKNLASALLTWSMKWMVENTHYRLFTAYSDVEAKELGTIYQACNFYYLGKDKGSKKMYCAPDSTKWFSDRAFRCRSAYKRYAKKFGIVWQKNWNIGDKMMWENIPNEIEQLLRQHSKDYIKECLCRTVPPKHKYMYILGKNKKETQSLRKLFLSNNKTFPYPKVRGE